MMVAGVAWGMYSLLGRASSDALAATAGNFLLTLPMVGLMLLVSIHQLHGDSEGILLAMASGAFASGLGYALWYAVIGRMSGATAASVQLSVPLLAAAGGVMMMQESVSLRLMVTSMMILGGIALVVKKSAVGSDSR